MEYRGYDSAGIALIERLQSLTVYTRKRAKWLDLENLNWISTGTQSSTIGIGHTRWATHGEPNDVNAHPHSSRVQVGLAIIHNGIIENYASIKTDLTNKGYQFKSDTDSEVFIYFIDDIRKRNSCSLEEAVRLALQKVVGAYAIVIMSQDHPETLNCS